jgi:hypothetical protein
MSYAKYVLLVQMTYCIATYHEMPAFQAVVQKLAQEGNGDASEILAFVQYAPHYDHLAIKAKVLVLLQEA